MTEQKWTELEDDFLEWSGGTPPDSMHQVTVYVDYANPFDDVDLVRSYLIDWLTSGS